MSAFSLHLANICYSMKISDYIFIGDQSLDGILRGMAYSMKAFNKNSRTKYKSFYRSSFFFRETSFFLIISQKYRFYKDVQYFKSHTNYVQIDVVAFYLLILDHSSHPTNIGQWLQ